ncbi:hypothetical protein NDI37_21720 [Funiculus sociatus GB2-A5]|uniref:Uncharacterized protein n=1 Tax=Funiculus sociatus GB2-A5 TaxID=2933946 RepID=A0ABV0JUF1_9CYAN|nr:hypothetical protein [Trichocoleus sp. FACHB-832]MBD1905912.1 hypothetical protein [Trichocoleus sp. FACHB-832]MBD2063474.1 hypothetical protein [Trichocoleus sp. FACHB-6]
MPSAFPKFKQGLWRSAIASSTCHNATIIDKAASGAQKKQVPASGRLQSTGNDGQARDYWNTHHPRANFSRISSRVKHPNKY